MLRNDSRETIMKCYNSCKEGTLLDLFEIIFNNNELEDMESIIGLIEDIEGLTEFFIYSEIDKMGVSGPITELLLIHYNDKKEDKDYSSLNSALVTRILLYIGKYMVNEFEKGMVVIDGYDTTVDKYDQLHNLDSYKEGPIAYHIESILRTIMEADIPYTKYMVKRILTTFKEKYRNIKFMRREDL